MKVMTRYEVHYSDDPQRGEEIEFFKVRSEATKRGKALSGQHAWVLVEQVWLSDEDTYEQFRTLAEYEGGKSLKAKR